MGDNIDEIEKNKEIAFAYFLTKAISRRFKLYLQLYGCEEDDVECIKEAHYDATTEVLERFGFSERTAEKIAERTWKKFEKNIKEVLKEL